MAFTVEPKARHERGNPYVEMQLPMISPCTSRVTSLGYQTVNVTTVPCEDGACGTVLECRAGGERADNQPPLPASVTHVALAVRQLLSSRLHRTTSILKGKQP
jgi:hypothetical protein